MNLKIQTPDRTCCSENTARPCHALHHSLSNHNPKSSEVYIERISWMEQWRSQKIFWNDNFVGGWDPGHVIQKKISDMQK